MESGNTELYDSQEEQYRNLVAEFDGQGNRIVGADVVISTLYRYYRESFCVKIIDANDNIIGRFDPAHERDAPWRGSAKNTDLRIDYFLSGVSGKINTVECTFGGTTGSGQRNPNGSYNIAEQEFTHYKNSKFKEEFVEVVNSGIYETAEDGSQIILTPGGKTIYITYTEI